MTGPVHCGRLCPSWPSANVRAYHIANCNLWQQILTALCGPVTVLKWPWEVFSVFLFLWDTKGHWCTNVHNKSGMQRNSGTQFIALHSLFFLIFYTFIWTRCMSEENIPTGIIILILTIFQPAAVIADVQSAAMYCRDSDADLWYSISVHCSCWQCYWNTGHSLINNRLQNSQLVIHHDNWGLKKGPLK